MRTKLSDKRKEELRLQKIKENKSKTLVEQLAYYVGEYIVAYHLPTLSTDVLQGGNVIQVSEEDAKENNKLRKNMIKSIFDDIGDNWDNYSNHIKLLEEKYLPKKLIIPLEPLNVDDIDAFKRGLKWPLWNSDICAYNLEPENIKIWDDDNGLVTYIELQLDISRNN